VGKTGSGEECEPAADLLQRAQGGCNRSLGDLLQLYSDYLRLVAARELGPDLRVKMGASDLVQESFMEAKRDFAHFKGNSAAEFQAWLRHLLLNNLSNLARNFRATRKRDITREAGLSDRLGGLGDGLGAGFAHTASSIVVQNEEMSALEAARQRLPLLYQQVIHLRNQELLPFSVVGERLGRSDEAARKLWVRALELLQKELEANGRR